MSLDIFPVKQAPIYRTSICQSGPVSICLSGPVWTSLDQSGPVWTSLYLSGHV